MEKPDSLDKKLPSAPLDRRSFLLGVSAGVAGVLTLGVGTAAALSNRDTKVYDLVSDLFGLDIKNEFDYPNDVPRISRDYGAAGHLDGKVLRWWEDHDGIDIREVIGYPVIAAADGVVIMSGPNPQRGERVILYHGKNEERSAKHSQGSFVREVVYNPHVFSGYFNMDKRNVETGQKVMRGEKVGTIGNSGLSRKPHLHFMAWTSFDGEYAIKDGLVQHGWQVVSPHTLWLRDEGIEPKDIGRVKIPVLAKNRVVQYSLTPITFTYPVPSI